MEVIPKGVDLPRSLGRDPSRTAKARGPLSQEGRERTVTRAHLSMFGKLSSRVFMKFFLHSRLGVGVGVNCVLSLAATAR